MKIVIIIKENLQERQETEIEFIKKHECWLQYELRARDALV